MNESQRFAIDNIYCAPSQDRQYSFKLVRVNKKNLPVKGKVDVYNTSKYLPNTTSYFHVFTIGNLFPGFLNLMSQRYEWLVDVWIKASDDMVIRDYILKIYNSDGLMYPRQHVYYSFIDESSLLIAIEQTPNIKDRFDVTSFVYMNVYSNNYFESANFVNNNVRKGIEYKFQQVNNNTDKANLQTYINTMKTTYGGDVFIYVDGYYTDKMSLNVPNGSFVEIVYDQSVISIEKFNISDLRTFQSVKDNRLKYLVYRDLHPDSIQFEDDTEVYVVDTSGYYDKGLFFYKHKPYAMRNVTDKDYSLEAMYINNTAVRLSSLTTGSGNDKTVTIINRISGTTKDLKYSSLKLHELYKLPYETQRDVVSNMSYTVDILRAEQLENSSYFEIAAAGKLFDITPELAYDALGYNGIAYYFANTPLRVNQDNIDVPEVYQQESTAFEYDQQGIYKEYHPTYGPVYSRCDTTVKYVDFMYGKPYPDYGRYYNNDEVFTLLHNEYVILSAYFNGVTRESNWEIISGTNKVTVNDNEVTLSEVSGKKVKVVYFNQIHIQEVNVDLLSGNIYFPLTIKEDRGTGTQTWPMDVCPSDIDVFLNNRKLTMGLDYFISFPYISICNKKYLDYSLPEQKIQVRASGFTLDKSKINSTEIRGFVNNGVLTRNKLYDIRDDRVFTVYVDGKIRSRDHVRYSEDDNTVRIDFPFNGLPYTIKESFIPLKTITGLDTLPEYNRNIENNEKISDLYNLIFKEPSIDEFNIIPTAHFVFSPVLSTIINDIIRGSIVESFYINPYSDNDIITMLDNNYKHLSPLDPLKNNMPDILVEIHPHLGNSLISLTLHQYRFITNVVRILTNNNPSKVKISGYLTVST